jgi:hypothetical protein
VKKVGGAILFGAANARMKVFHFTARGVTPQDLAGAVVDGLAGGGFTFEIERSVMVRTGVVKASLRSPKVRTIVYCVLCTVYYCVLCTIIYYTIMY